MIRSFSSLFVSTLKKASSVKTRIIGWRNSSAFYTLFSILYTHINHLVHSLDHCKDYSRAFPEISRQYMRFHCNKVSKNKQIPSNLSHAMLILRIKQEREDIHVVPVLNMSNRLISASRKHCCLN